MSSDLVTKKYKSVISFRPCLEPTVALPFGARSSGHCRALKGWQDQPIVKNFVQMFWTVKGCGWFKIDGHKVMLPEEHAVVFRYGERHLLGAVSDLWEYRFMTVDGSGCMDLIKSLEFPRFPVYAGICPEELFIKLAEEVQDITPRGQRLASVTAYQLVAMACGGVAKASDKQQDLVLRCEQLILRNYCNRDFDINTLATKLNVHRSRVSRIFRDTRGITLIDFLVSLRLNQALSLLKKTNLSINEIAGKCGFSSADYLGKSIKRATGMSPIAFRNQ